MIQDIKIEYPDCELVVIVNNDHQVKLKKSIPFLDESARCYILNHIKGVDKVVLSIDLDSTIVRTLENIYTNINVDIWPEKCHFLFCNGGDRDSTSAVTPEVEFCIKNNIKLKYGWGDNKTYSSSGLINKACDYILAK